MALALGVSSSSSCHWQCPAGPGQSADSESAVPLAVSAPPAGAENSTVVLVPPACGSGFRESDSISCDLEPSSGGLGGGGEVRVTHTQKHGSSSVRVSLRLGGPGSGQSLSLTGRGSGESGSESEPESLPLAVPVPVPVMMPGPLAVYTRVPPPGRAPQAALEACSHPRAGPGTGSKPLDPLVALAEEEEAPVPLPVPA